MWSADLRWSPPAGAVVLTPSQSNKPGPEPAIGAGEVSRPPRAWATHCRSRGGSWHPPGWQRLLLQTLFQTDRAGFDRIQRERIGWGRGLRRTEPDREGSSRKGGNAFSKPVPSATRPPLQRGWNNRHSRRLGQGLGSERGHESLGIALPREPSHHVCRDDELR